ncbi:DUF7512 family protein [Natronolimnohabitans innermongolicus]|uniref:Uncharacterized protein n=1 Tax=Natronolimnohabitans innermongolicus JCM 12255 TaxID=1227499 RepID=L9XKX2_9EURY|nr:hypothetical protein [Natronolimnohabitans innermongolicus]ELY62222.1 hypothetical protein C493_00295 [Natronolimnohabitans innermongolicus JCM 12255]
MIGIEGGVTGAFAVVGFILVQAIALYVAYGWLESIVETIRSDKVN